MLQPLFDSLSKFDKRAKRQSTQPDILGPTSSSSFYKPLSKLSKQDSNSILNKDLKDENSTQNIDKPRTQRRIVQKQDNNLMKNYDQFETSYKCEYGYSAKNIKKDTQSQNKFYTPSPANVIYNQNSELRKNLKNNIFQNDMLIQDALKNYIEKNLMEKANRRTNSNLDSIDKINDKKQEKELPAIQDEETPSKPESITSEITSESLQNIFIIDNITTKDILQIIPDEILYNKNINFEKLFEENSDYLYHLIKQCALDQFQGHNSNKQLRNYLIHKIQKQEVNLFKIKQMGCLKSHYDNVFYQQSQNPDLYVKMPTISEELFTSKFNPIQQVGKYETLKDELVNHNVRPINKEIKEFVKQERPLQKLTTYGNNYINYKEYDYESYRGPQLLSTGCKMPPNYTTAYNKFENIIILKDPRQNQEPASKFGVLSKNNTFKNEETSYTRDNKINKNSYINQKSQEQFYVQKIPSFDGQYNTITHKDYKNISADNSQSKYIKNMFSQKLISKMEELRQKKLNKEQQ